MSAPLITPPFQVPFYNPQTRDIDRQWKDYLLFLTRQIALAFAPIDGSYVVTGNVPGLINEFDLGLLTSGLLKQTVAGAVATPAIAIAGTDYTALAFKTIQVATQSDIVADSAADTLTFAAGSGVTLTTNAGTDTLTITASGSGGTVTTTGSPVSGDIAQFSGASSITTARVGITTRALTFGFSGALLASGKYVDVYIPYACTITAATVMGDVSGSVVFDVLKNASFSSAPASSIVASAPPTLSSALGSQDTTLTGWTTSVAAGVRMRASVTSTSGLGWASLTLTVTV